MSDRSGLSKNSLYCHIRDRVRLVIPQDFRNYPLHEPDLSGNELKYLSECVETNFVSSVGKFVDDFEGELALYTGAKHAIVTVNGTSALQLALQVIGVTRGDEVIVPSLTFAATAAAVCHLGGVPNFVDICPIRLGICPERLEAYLNEIIDYENGIAINRRTSRRIKACVPMHTFGHPVDMDKLKPLCKKFGIPIIEDAAEALGSKINQKQCGTLGEMGVLSFNGNKIITTGGGGAILTNNTELAERVKYLSTTAKESHPWRFIHGAVGYNYRMPNINAALGLAQLENIERKLFAKRSLAKSYELAFADSELVTFFKEPKNCVGNYWLNTIILTSCDFELQDYILKRLHEDRIFARPVWESLHQLDPYKVYPRDELIQTESLAAKIINLPSSVSLVSEKVA